MKSGKGTSDLTGNNKELNLTSKENRKGFERA
jgi:hypothetical protein